MNNQRAVKKYLTPFVFFLVGIFCLIVILNQNFFNFLKMITSDFIKKDSYILQNFQDLLLRSLLLGISFFLMFRIRKFFIIITTFYTIGAVFSIIFGNLFNFHFSFIINICCTLVISSSVIFIFFHLEKKFHLNEIIVGLLSNFIVIYLGVFLLKITDCVDTSTGKTHLLNSNDLMPSLSIMNQQWSLSLFLVPLLLIGFYFYGKKSNYLFLSDAYGKNPNSLNQYAPKNALIFKTYLFSALLATLAGALFYLNSKDRFLTSSYLAYNEAFDGILINFLCGSSGIGIFLSSILFSFMNLSKNYFQIFGINLDYSILLLYGLCLFFMILKYLKRREDFYVRS